MQARPSVLLVLASSGWGGTEKAVVDLANALAPRCRVSVAVPGDAEYRSRFGDRVHAIRALPPGSRRNPLVLRRLAAIIREEGADVVHTHAAKASEMVYWIGRFRPIRQVATKHNTRSRRVFRWLRHVTAVSEAVRASIGRLEGVTVVYNGIDVVAPTPAPKSDIFTILAVGRLHPHKGFDRLVRAVARLPFECMLQIAGEGPERAALQTLVRDLGVGERVALLGHREDVPALMSSADVQVVPSRTEGFSLALAEGLLCSDVVISTRVGIAPEVLPAELLVEPEGIAERLEDVHARYEHYVDVTRGVRVEVGDRFLLSRTAERYLEVYERVVRG